MINVVFTVDYELYGNGLGSLKDLIYDPAQQLVDIFQKYNARFVAFVEAAELERIDLSGSDPAIDLVKHQVGRLYEDGFEIALHLHPQWCNAQYSNGRWCLDYDEYNLCNLSRTRIAQIVDTSIEYLRRLVHDAAYTPLAFRAGNWLFQPTRTAASILAECGIKVDSSVFKGGVLHDHNLDYRPSLPNGYYWPFHDDVNAPNEKGEWIEVPIYSEMVLPWTVATSKRMRLENSLQWTGQGWRRRINRLRDFARFHYPLKFDFCRTDIGALTSMIDGVVEEDRRDPGLYRPIVSIGHTKDFTDPERLTTLLEYLRTKEIAICTFAAVYAKICALRGKAAEVSVW